MFWLMASVIAQITLNASKASGSGQRLRPAGLFSDTACPEGGFLPTSAAWRKLDNFLTAVFKARNPSVGLFLLIAN